MNNRDIEVGDYVSPKGQPDKIGKVTRIATKGIDETAWVDFPDFTIPQAIELDALDLRSILDLLADI